MNEAGGTFVGNPSRVWGPLVRVRQRLDAMTSVSAWRAQDVKTAPTCMQTESGRLMKPYLFKKATGRLPGVQIQGALSGPTS